MNAAEFVGKMFLDRDIAHRVYLSTKSYAKHKALNEFYDEIVDLADTFAETYQGRHGLLNIPLQSSKKIGSIIDFLQSELDEIEKERYAIVSKSDTPLHNIIDEICGLYLRTLYKLKNLS